MNITPVGNPIHDDFFSVVGTGIPDDAVFEFSTDVGIVQAIPTFVRPHLALVARLPTSIPTGAANLRLTSPTTAASNSISVTVAATPLQTVRQLQPGEPKPDPYSVVFVANPGIESTGGGSFTPDPILTNRPGYHSVVNHCLRNLFGVTEDLFRTANMDARMRFTSVFDTTRPANSANSLAHKIPASNLMETRRTVLAPFLASYGLAADVVFVIHGSTTHTRASAWYTTDDHAKGSTAYTYDGVARKHGHFAKTPGSAAIAQSGSKSGLTIIHEFGHAASDFNNGIVFDLYNDATNPGTFLVNKKFRSVVGGAIPTNFATYNRAVYLSDPARDGLGYPTSWKSYHADPVDGTRPNLMDDYWQAFDDPQLCRFDKLTAQWYLDRLNAKLTR